MHSLVEEAAAACSIRNSTTRNIMNRFLIEQIIFAMKNTAYNKVLWQHNSKWLEWFNNYAFYTQNQKKKTEDVCYDVNI